MHMRSFFRYVKRSLPPRAARLAERAVLVQHSLRDRRLKQEIFGDQVHFVPPLYFMEDGTRDYKEFKQNGLDAFRRFVSAGLRPTDRILDIGSGIGRKTLPLLEYVTTGSYEGLDPIATQVRWCTERITARFSNFRFQRIDVWSKHYNQGGRVRASDYKFPFPSAEFDFIIMGSVFTHMFPHDVGHYIAEVSRVLKKGGRGWITFFLLNEESLTAISNGRSSQKLVHEVEEGSRADNPDRTETAIGHREELVLGLFTKNAIDAKVAEFGSWCGRQGDYYQDIVNIIRK
jgi:ubiquinone/menaquinone biosynthesis C-methylase UbiE